LAAAAAAHSHTVTVTVTVTGYDIVLGYRIKARADFYVIGGVKHAGRTRDSAVTPSHAWTT
jgi:hypothetical protein